MPPMRGSEANNAAPILTSTTSSTSAKSGSTKGSGKVGLSSADIVQLEHEYGAHK